MGVTYCRKIPALAHTMAIICISGTAPGLARRTPRCSLAWPLACTELHPIAQVFQRGALIRAGPVRGQNCNGLTRTGETSNGNDGADLSKSADDSGPKVQIVVPN